VDPGLLIAGEIGKPHGLTGEVYVVPISDDPQRFQPGARLIHDDGRELSIAAVRTHGTRLLVQFEGVDDRTAAESLRGTLFVGRDQLRSLGDDEYWSHELTGCEVQLPDGQRVGEVTDIVPAPAQDLLQIDTAAGNRLVPLVKEIVIEVDLDARKIVIAPPDGLLD
jgi:16S rRNA processing protein RimM